MESDTNSGDYPSRTSSSYAISGKIMLIMIIVLFTIVITMVFLHLYARWYLIQARRRLNLRRRHRSRTATHLVFYVDPNNDTGPGGATANRGLDPSVLKTLPVFVYGYESSKEMTMTMKTIECAVCLSEFEDNETVRCLPKCNHCFHIDCIDMWFHSHSTCPLCRSPVEINETGTESVNDDHVVIAVNETSPAEDVNGSTSGYCSSCRHDEGAGMNRVHSTPSSSSSLFGMRRKRPPWVLPIEVPRRTDDDFVVESPASQSYKSPVGRIRSFRRIMSRGSPSPSGGGGTSWGLSEVDIERGRDDLTPRIRVETPK